jgi:predicted DNA-binding transcriptional regulator AlpA
MSHASTGLSEHEKHEKHFRDAKHFAPPDQPPPPPRKKTRPRKGRRLLSFPELKERKGIKFSRVWITRLVAEGKFPKPVVPGMGGEFARKSWFEDEVDDWLNGLAETRDKETAETA